MGTTVLHVLPDEPDAAMLYFTKFGRGARRWQRIVDDLGLLGELIATQAGVAIERLDPPDVSIGRGARFKLPIKLAALLVAHLEHRYGEDVAAGDFVVLAGEIPGAIIDAARRVVARRCTAGGMR